VKRPLRRQFLHLAAGATALASAVCLSFGSWSQTARTIKIIVPFAPGGGGSVLARVYADQFERQRLVTAVVENRPGAASTIGTEAVARAAPDGNTVLVTNTTIVINPHLRKQNYDPFNSFEPICGIATGPSFFAVNTASPYYTLPDLLNAARAKPGEITMATFAANIGQIGLEMLKRMANVDITFVPFPGGAPAVTAVLGGHVTAIFDNYATMGEHVSAGRLRVLATAWPTRTEAFPNIPTVAEAAGLKDYGVRSWWGSFAPTKTPREKMAQLADWFAAASQVPEVKSKLAPLGFASSRICGAEFAAQVRKSFDDFGRVIREANIKAE
jgi:tripartite-type tricarboxylate transporter receptor subunit TctC